MGKGTPGVRYAEVERESEDTRVQVVLDLDGGTKQDIQTGIGFFDHMLQLFAFHGHIDLGVKAEGDLEIDDHHLVEDVGIALGQALKEAIRNSEGISRYGSNQTPMDEALALVAVDVSGRPYLAFDATFKRDVIGELSTECIREFFRTLANHSGLTIHIRMLAGDNGHHICEAIFKGFGLAVREATSLTERKGSSSTKSQRE